jgi:hypothetical protein
MNIGFKLNIFGYTLSTFDIRIDIDKDTAAAVAQPVIDGAIKKVSRRWVSRLTT